MPHEPELTNVPSGTLPAASKIPGAFPVTAEWRRRLKFLGMLTAILLLAFCIPVYELGKLSFHSDLNSHVLLIPFISAYLAWTFRDRWMNSFVPAGRLVLIPAAVGVVILIGYAVARSKGWHPPTADRLAVVISALLCLVWSACLLTLGRSAVWKLAFPILFLIFSIPMPSGVEHAIETFLQHASADVAYVFLKLAGTPVFRDGTQFRLPNITIEVAPECSGIRSSLVLFITALLAGYFFLRKSWLKVVLGFLVIGLGIVRNAFRIFVLCELCVNVDPAFIDSPLHHKGGPIFFAVSLIPFFLLVWILRKLDRRKSSETAKLEPAKS